ncbi:hypothetical protein P154DRAFT_35155 [Amniculicola lignicola CBS 123094]|uniref:Uncharacterized protein n=1 Tax=Amniculicola lignicola CBS 123094 TaxID=1392246 RepID=A0A6A5X1Y7_9PLEO|nr:hypothetical protein P154DRAFT_35155 [Amniculicola lignicola CBS 123094]
MLHHPRHYLHTSPFHTVCIHNPNSQSPIAQFHHQREASRMLSPPKHSTSKTQSPHRFPCVSAYLPSHPPMFPQKRSMPSPSSVPRINPLPRYHYPRPTRATKHNISQYRYSIDMYLLMQMHARYVGDSNTAYNICIYVCIHYTTAAELDSDLAGW